MRGNTSENINKKVQNRVIMGDLKYGNTSLYPFIYLLIYLFIYLLTYYFVFLVMPCNVLPVILQWEVGRMKTVERHTGGQGFVE